MEIRKISSPLTDSVTVERQFPNQKSNGKSKVRNNVQIESETHYVLTNLKKSKRVMFENHSPEPTATEEKISPTV
jgi:hypothetical protein